MNDRMYNIIERIFGLEGLEKSSGSSSFSTLTKTSALKTYAGFSKDKNNYIFRIELPGFSKEEVEVVTANSMLIVKAEHLKDEPYHLRKSLKTSLHISGSLDIDNIDATMKYGILTVTIPVRNKEMKRKKVDIK